MSHTLYLVFLSTLPLIGFMAGAVVARLTRRKPYVEPKAICEGCEHHASFHEENGGRCHHFSPKHDYYDYDEHACTCLRYTGPIPMPTYLPPTD